MRHYLSGTWCCLLLLASHSAVAQGDYRPLGWETGLDINYRLDSDVDFDGGSSIDVDDDFGLAASFGYRLNPHLEFQVTLDWANVDYRAHLQSALIPALQTTVSGGMEAFTVLGKVAYNFLDGPLTPFVTGGIGWSFVDTNIPNGEVGVGCWWDPWYGNICTPYQNTRTFDEFAYVLGAGVRWDTSPRRAFKFSYERQLLDVGEASSTPSFDLLKAGFIFKY